MKTSDEKKNDYLDQRVRLTFKPDRYNITTNDLWATLKGIGIKIDGFTTTKRPSKRPSIQESGEDESTYDVKNAFGNGCSIRIKPQFRSKKNSKEIILHVGFEIDNVISAWWTIRKAGHIYEFLYQLENIEKEYRAFAAEEEKKEKISNITQNSIKTWIKSILQDTPYYYYTEITDNKINLHIKLKNSLQLNIPIYYKSFQKIMPELITTIRQYENTANNSKIKVLIDNYSPSTHWVKPDIDGSAIEQ